jgi:hypothetical protein
LASFVSWNVRATVFFSSIGPIMIIMIWIKLF